jgi:LPS-assembly protein
VAYTRGQTEKSIQHRETFWIGAEGFTNLSRRFSLGENNWVRHSIKPHVMYEFVPPTDQSDLVQIDAIDDLIKKSLVTYALKNRISQQDGSGESSTWLDVLFAQSYHVGNPPPLASRFSDIWTRGEFHKPLGSPYFLSAFNLTVDTFLNPYEQEFRQVNTDAFIQGHQDWYVSVGQRFTRAGPRVRRGDIWTPLSFNEMLLPGEKILFLTAGGAMRLPLGLTLGTRWYHDVETGETSEWDVVGLYQNPCRCFSLGLYYQEFPDRTQFDFLITLTGLWGTQSNGTELMKSILGPLMPNAKGVPWDYR